MDAPEKVEQNQEKIMKSFAMVALCLFAGNLLAQNQIARSVIANGASAAADTTYRIVGTIGQPLIGRVQNSSITHAAGFWYTTFDLVTSVEQMEDESLPSQFRLDQNYPNPFNPTTTIQFAVAKSAHVKLQIFDILGRRVATLIDDLYEPGVYKSEFAAGSLASGIYIYHIQTGDFSATRKLTLLK